MGRSSQAAIPKTRLQRGLGSRISRPALRRLRRCKIEGGSEEVEAGAECRRAAFDLYPFPHCGLAVGPKCRHAAGIQIERGGAGGKLQTDCLAVDAGHHAPCQIQGGAAEHQTGANFRPQAARFGEEGLKKLTVMFQAGRRHEGIPAKVIPF